MIALKSGPSGVTLPIRVQTKSSNAKVGGEHDGRLKVHVCAPPEKGKANRAVVEILAKTLGVSKSRVTIIGGELSREKLVLVTGLAVADVEQRLKLRPS